MVGNGNGWSVALTLRHRPRHWPRFHEKSCRFGSMGVGARWEMIGGGFFHWFIYTRNCRYICIVYNVYISIYIYMYVFFSNCIYKVMMFHFHVNYTFLDYHACIRICVFCVFVPFLNAWHVSDAWLFHGWKKAWFETQEMAPKPGFIL